MTFQQCAIPQNINESLKGHLDQHKKKICRPNVLMLVWAVLFKIITALPGTGLVAAYLRNVHCFIFVPAFRIFRVESGVEVLQ